MEREHTIDLSSSAAFPFALLGHLRSLEEAACLAENVADNHMSRELKAPHQLNKVVLVCKVGIHLREHAMMT